MTKKLTGEYNKAEKLSAEDANRVYDAGRRGWHVFKHDGKQKPDKEQVIQIDEGKVIEALGQDYEARLKATGIRVEALDIPVIDDSDKSRFSTFRRTVNIDSSQLAGIAKGITYSAMTEDQAVDILDNGFQTFEMDDGLFGISKSDAKRILGENYGTLLIEASSSLTVDGDNITLDMASIQKIAKFEAGDARYTNDALS